MIVVDVQALRRGDETAFLSLVTAYNPVLLRLAMVYSPTRAVAEETVQETWIAVLRGIDGFEGRAALRTWICRILVNIAHRRSAAEVRSLPFSSFSNNHEDSPAVAPDRFLQSGPYAGHWASPLPDWSSVPEHKLLSDELKGVVADAIAQLPEAQRIVITLRDVEGWTSEETCELLELEPGHQRVLLHRARSRVRAALDRYLVAEVAEE
ncbi:sigma-70 family RNA polymerase sigma factor [Amycolatopsis sp. A133]|uniref:sigma-70 family RNA polymerase sigma factor n=1 Tax=Amycolatopsis sp. A133 TaxID=3064472 RepID=UPI0027E83422|nr:sigma-70 family RNA polymerase sigma factor [Amycolatopsis sp. A133]MDQ7808751.1 sigma-70 family RNA polymerase sigma factor [Amycolatopsis sp. A133]